MEKKRKALDHKKKKTLDKFVWRSGEKYRFIVWDENIQKIFMTLLIITIILLSLLTYTQHLLIKELFHKKVYKTMASYDEVDRANLIDLELFAQENNLSGATIGDLAAYFKSQGYDVEIGIGILEASLKECGDDMCSETVYRFNQRKGMYLDMFVIESSN